MGDEHYPLIRLRGGNDLLFGREPVDYIRGQVPSFPELLDVLLCNRGSHPLALRSRSGHGWGVLVAMEKIGTRALELEWQMG